MILKTYTVIAKDFDHAGCVSSDIKRWAKSENLDADLIRRLAIACYEAEINMIIHSLGGTITLSLDDDDLKLIFQDSGPGIENIELAMKAGWSSANDVAQSMGFGAGLGLPNIHKNADTFKLESCCEGTKLTLGFKLKGETHDSQ